MIEKMQKYCDFSAGTLKVLLSIGVGVLALSLLAEFFVHLHPHFSVEEFPAFHAWYGFLACTAIVIFSNALGKLLKRKEGYYEGKKR